jgi:hypothetical protein
MQIVLAVVGTICAAVVWSIGGGVLWLLGALLLASVVPMTLVAIKPVNDVLLDESHDPDSEDTEGLSRQWGPKHLWRSIVSGASFILFLVGNGSGV